MRRALVIGGTGFIGSHIVHALVSRGVDVCVTRRARSNRLLLRNQPVRYYEASLEDAESVRRAAVGCDVVFMCAGYYPRYSLNARASIAEGVRGIRNACAAALAAGVERMVYTSSIGTLDVVAPRPAMETDIAPSMPEGSVYRAVKWAMEREIDRAQARGLTTVTLLPGGCLGPGDLRVGTGAFIVGVVRGELPWWVDGSVNLVDVADVAQAHVAAASVSGDTRFCLAGHHIRVGSLLEHLVSRYGGKVPTTCLSAGEARRRANSEERVAASARQRVPIPREIVDLVTSGQVISDARARAALGFAPRSLDETLDRAHAWFSRLGLVAKTERKIDASTN